MRKKIISSIILSCMLIISMCIPIHAFPPSSDDIYEGIDVSDWQGYIDFKKVKDSGIDMVYIRASEGTNYVDSYFRENYDKTYTQKQNEKKLESEGTGKEITGKGKQ